MSFTVILVNWRNEQQTLRCVAAVRAWKALKPGLIVIDNESSETSSTVLADVLAPDELICSPLNLGYGGGNNLGIQHSLVGKKNYILLLNSDAEISEAGLTRLLARMEANRDISVLGPVIYEGYDGHVQCLIGGRDIAQNSSTRIAAEPGTLTAVPGYPLHEVDYVSGTVFLARRGVFEQIGLLDEQYFFSGEIADFCKRAKNGGHRICVDLEVEAHHDTSQTSTQLRETLYTYYSLRNRFLYVRKHYPSKKFKYFSRWTKLCSLEFVRSIKARKTARARAILLALAHAYGNRGGNQNAKFD
jgi:GT2 family glycosyltransferase